MYSKFRLESGILKPYLDGFEQYNGLTPVDIDKEKDKVYRQLQFFEGKDGVLDGKDLREYTFPNGEVDEYNVFISYSHNDTELAKRLCAYLQDYCGLRVFLDYYVWKSADSLLRRIDDCYCKTRDNVHYIYGRRNFSTSHVHAMLSMAIMDIINKTECCIFLDSGHSIQMKSLENASKARTLSPWLYEELSFMRYLPTQTVMRRTKYFSSGLENLFEGMELKIAHEVELKGFLPMDTIDLQLLAQYKGTRGLDSLYHRYSYKADGYGVRLTDYEE